MRKRWMLSTDGGVTYDTEVTPVNAVKFQRTFQPEKGQIFRRRVLNSDLSFRGVDFDLLYPFERNPSQRCVSLYIRQEKRCSGFWIPFWTGRFSAGSARWNLSGCSLSVRPDPYDRYTCILDKLESKVNILQAEAVDIVADIEITLEWGLFTSYSYEDFGGGSGCLASWVYPTNPIGDEWGVAFTVPMPDPLNGAYGHIVFWREVYTTDCINGIPAPPVGTGWQLLTNNCGIDGTAVFWRVPVFPFPGPEVVYGAPIAGMPDCEDGFEAIEIHPGGPPDSESDPACHPDLPPIYICYPTTTVQFSRARTLQSVLELLLSESGCDVTEVVSDLFEINPVGDAPGYSPGINYVTGLANQWDHLFIIQKSDASYPWVSQSATIEERTLGYFLKIFLQLHEMFWDIDAAGRLRIEHISYWVFAQGMDLSTGDGLQENLGRCEFMHLREAVPRYERYTCVDQRGEDFIGADIVYDGPCVAPGGSQVLETSADVTTDLAYVYGDPPAVDQRGIVIVATAFDGISYTVINEVGILSGNTTVNNPMSWSALHNAFFRHYRFLRTGNMNRVDTTFTAIRPNIEQVPLTVSLCCDNLTWDAMDTVKTELGQRFLVQRKGIVYTEELDDNDNTMTLTLRYAY